MQSTQLATIENESTAIAQITPAVYLMPALSVRDAVERQQYLQQVVGELLTESKGADDFAGADYGLLPGTKDRTLFFNGAQKLCLFFGLNIDLICTRRTEDWDKGFFFYEYKATAKDRGGNVIGSIERSCHTRETKYAWVWVVAPKPGQAEEAQMKAEGIGKNKKVWIDGRQQWAWHERRPNPDPYSLQMVVQAMSEKRAYVAITKIVLAAQGFFSKEIDFTDYREQIEQEDGERAQRPAAKKDDSGKLRTPAAAVSPEEKRVNDALLAHFIKEKGEKNGPAFFESVWLGKLFVDREAKAKELGLIVTKEEADAKDTIQGKGDADDPTIAGAASDPGALLQADIEDLSAALVTDFKLKRKEVDEIIKGVATHTVLEEMSPGLLEQVKAALTQRIAQLRKAK